jgi:hypothetical protein
MLHVSPPLWKDGLTSLTRRYCTEKTDKGNTQNETDNEEKFYSVARHASGAETSGHIPLAD